jgi:hypothetical protein
VNVMPGNLALNALLFLVVTLPALRILDGPTLKPAGDSFGEEGRSSSSPRV